MNASIGEWLAALERVTGKQRRGTDGDWRFPCPAHGGTDPNLSVTERDGKILTTCFSHGCSHEDIRAALDLDDPPVRPSIPAPMPGPPRETGVWHYYLANGAIAFEVVRHEPGKNGRAKDYFPRLPDGTLKGYPAPRPLYNLRDLVERASAPVLVVEGEKTADAAAERFPAYVVVTSAGGANAVNKSDWSALAGRNVTIWPDADAPGRQYAERVTEAAKAAQASRTSVVTVPPHVVPTGWDLADSVPDGLDVERMLEQRPRPLPALSLTKIREIPEEDRQWIVDGLLPADGVSMLVAPPKVGKSTLARCLAVAMTKDGGIRWIGRDVRMGPVLHLALEERRQTVRQHYDMLGAHGDHIYILSDAPANPDDRNPMLRETIREVGAALVIIDPLFRWTRIEDGNSYAETMKALDPILAIARERNTHIMLVHHARKSGGEYGSESLGSTGLAASVDTVLSLSRENARRILYGFGRDGVELEKTLLRMDEDGWISAAETKRAADLRDLARRVLDLLESENELMTGPQIRHRLGANKERCNTAVRMLVNDGDVEQLGDGNRRRYRIPLPPPPTP